MSDSCYFSLEDLAVKEIAPGFYSKLIHTANNTINFLEVKAGSAIPLHQHVHEQSSFVLAGEFEMTVQGETRVLTPGVYCLIPSMVMHGGRAITDSKLIDIFSPVREDYK
jgi:quercetin dioxygenase-like cupin family protein